MRLTPASRLNTRFVPGRKQADQDGKNEGALDRVTIECGSLVPVPPLNEGTPAVPGHAECQHTAKRHAERCEHSPA